MDELSSAMEQAAMEEEDEEDEPLTDLMVDDEELAELRRLADEYAAEQAAFRAATAHNLPEASTRSADEQAALNALAASFNQERAPRPAESATWGGHGHSELRTYTYAGLPPVRVVERLHSARELLDGLGHMIWPAAELLASWIGAQRESAAAASAAAGTSPPQLSTASSEPLLLRGVSSAIELGAGTGLVSMALALGGVARVVATDGDATACALCSASSDANGVGAQVRVLPLPWGAVGEQSGALQEALHACGAGGRCADLIVAADVLYAHTERHGEVELPVRAAWLEHTLRGLIGAGGCSYVALSWCDRLGGEPAFLSRLSDLGSVRTVHEQPHTGVARPWRCGISLLEVTKVGLS
jgi:hypothetical protein